MRKIKSFKLFENLDNDVIVIRDLLLDFEDNDIDVSVGIWRRHFSNHFHKYQGLRCIRVEIGDYVKMFTLSELGVSLLEVIEYCESQGLFLMDDSTISSPLWQEYEGCPKCLSDDLDRQTIVSGEKRLQTRCKKCGYIDLSREFLLGDWPLTEDRLSVIISEGKRISNIQLYFSGVKSVY